MMFRVYLAVEVPRPNTWEELSIPHLAWEYLSASQAELEDVAEE